MGQRQQRSSSWRRSSSAHPASTPRLSRTNTRRGRGGGRRRGRGGGRGGGNNGGPDIVGPRPVLHPTPLWAGGHNPWTGVVHAYTMPVPRPPPIPGTVGPHPPTHQAFIATPPQAPAGLPYAPVYGGMMPQAPPAHWDPALYTALQTPPRRALLWRWRLVHGHRSLRTHGCSPGTPVPGWFCTAVRVPATSTPFSRPPPLTLHLGRSPPASTFGTLALAIPGTGEDPSSRGAAASRPYLGGGPWLGSAPKRSLYHSYDASCDALELCLGLTRGALEPCLGRHRLAPDTARVALVHYLGHRRVILGHRCVLHRIALEPQLGRCLARPRLRLLPHRRWAPPRAPVRVCASRARGLLPAAPGFVDSAHPDHVCLLSRSLYGLKQAPRAWYQRIAALLHQLGFRSTHSDASLFAYNSDTTAYLLLYVDDIILTASSTDLCASSPVFAPSLPSRTWGLCTSSASRSCRTDGFFLHQRKYAHELLDRAVPHLDPPELQYAVQQVCLHMHAPREPHWAAVKRILRYIHGTMDFGLSLHASTATDIVAYSDADWAGCPDTRRSTSGYCVYFGPSLISWSSKRQPTVSRSSATEYRAVANAVARSPGCDNSSLSSHVLSPATVVLATTSPPSNLSANPVHHRAPSILSWTSTLFGNRWLLGTFEYFMCPPPNNLRIS
ncbi:hypothetical protein QYE76_003473 [Lolium multiflorum]|uniref:Reverse transcriptase Ty1/copia-type domain-containing protein n=1 Tax=Lolium multiflorum TaxID=4521 RepID=A0AAD8RNS6_LOLMU|nr:hypothetical protein QYE76_003473 [Lolium multiflorum]